MPAQELAGLLELPDRARDVPLLAEHGAEHHVRRVPRLPGDREERRLDEERCGVASAIARGVSANDGHLGEVPFEQFDEVAVEFDAGGGWGNGFRSFAHWLSWRIGLDLGASREKVRVARALGTSLDHLLVQMGGLATAAALRRVGIDVTVYRVTPMPPLNIGAARSGRDGRGR